MELQHIRQLLVPVDPRCGLPPLGDLCDEIVLLLELFVHGLGVRAELAHDAVVILIDGNRAHRTLCSRGIHRASLIGIEELAQFDCHRTVACSVDPAVVVGVGRGSRRDGRLDHPLRLAGQRIDGRIVDLPCRDKVLTARRSQFACDLQGIDDLHGFKFFLI